VSAAGGYPEAKGVDPPAGLLASAVAVSAAEGYPEVKGVVMRPLAVTSMFARLEAGWTFVILSGGMVAVL
jgi:hypothetical protein